MEEKRTYRSSRQRRSNVGPLTQYRLYFLQGIERRISFCHEFEAEDDERAIRIAESWREGRSAELWAGGRKVRSWEADK